jgi:homopolymeric O-antigen transport system permease protein
MLQNLKELYVYRALVSSLVVRELRVRYRGSVLGFLWTFLNPFLLMIVYAVVFLFYMRVQMENYATFMIIGLLPWLWFSTAVVDGSTGIIGRMDLLSKVRFPPQVLPMVIVSNHFLNFLFSVPMLFIFILQAERPLGLYLLAFPLICGVQFLLTFALAQLLGALTVQFRDLLHIINNLMVLFFFMTPILYPEQMIPEMLRFTIYINPMAPVIKAYQDIFYYGTWPNFLHLGIVFLFGVLFLIFSSEIFNRYRDDFAEEAL